MEPRISIISLGVQDLNRSFEFYHNGLGIPTKMSTDDGIVFFLTSGTRLAIYPLDKLCEDISASTATPSQNSFSGITLAHNVKNKAEVAEILELAQTAGGKIIKSAQDAFWGGYHGYFADPDGYIWEVAYADFWQFSSDGSLII